MGLGIRNVCIAQAPQMLSHPSMNVSIQTNNQKFESYPSECSLLNPKKVSVLHNSVDSNNVEWNRGTPQT